MANFASLSFLQGTNYLIPLIVFPYLTRILGISNYGLYALVQSVLLYFGMLIGFGFRLTATDKIAKSIEDKNEITNAFWDTIYTKIFLLAICFLILIMAGLLIPAVSQYFILFLAGFILLSGQLFIPDFFFLGIQKMGYITLATFIGKSFYAILIFILVKESNDVLQAIIANGVGVAIIGAIGFYYALRELNFTFKKPNLQNIQRELKEGLYVFFSQVSVSFYSTINVILLGAFTNTTIVGYYSIVEKIYKSLSSLIATPFNMAVYPKLSKWYIDNRELYKLRVKQMMILLFVIFSFFAILLFLFAQPVVEFLIKEPAEGEIKLLVRLVKVASLALLLNPFGAFFSQQFIIKDRRKKMLQIILFLGLVNIVLVMIFIPNIYLVVWAIVINRILAAVLNAYYALKE